MPSARGAGLAAVAALLLGAGLASAAPPTVVDEAAPAAEAPPADPTPIPVAPVPETSTPAPTPADPASAAPPLTTGEPTPASAAPPPASGEGTPVPAVARVIFEGRVREAGTRDPLAGAMVRLLTHPDVTVTDGEGRFRLPAPPGIAVLSVTSPGRPEVLLPVEVPAEPDGWLDLYVRAPEAGDAMVITSERDDPPISERTLNVDELRQVPGSLGDAVRAVQNLPGVAWAPLSLGLLIVRGSYPEESGFFMDGVPIPLVYHFLGVKTFVNTDFLERLTFMPGGFGVRYGRVLGGVIDLGTTMGHGARPKAYAEVDTFMSTFYATGPIGEHTGFSFSIRRSYIDKLIGPALDRFAADYTIQAPRFWDYQASVDRWVGDGHHLRLMVAGSSDVVTVFNGQASDVDQDALDDALFDYRVGLTQVQLRWDGLVWDRLYSQGTLAVGPQPNRLKVGSQYLEDDPFFISLRQEMRADLRPDLTLTAGLDAQAVRQSIRWDPNGGGDVEEIEPITAWTLSPSPYLEATIKAVPGLVITPGLRFDPLLIQDQGGMASVDPRLSARYGLRPGTVLKGVVGRYSSFPSSYEVLEGLGTPGLAPEHGIQTSLGLEQRLGPLLNLDVVGYYNRYQDLVVVSDLDISFEEAVTGQTTLDPDDLELYNNEGLGRAYGVELLLRRQMGADVWGWIAYALQRSERRADEDAPWIIFDYDQTHLLTLVGVWELPKGWSLGGRFRYGTGRPYTPVEGRVYTVDSGLFVPLTGEPNSGRYPGLLTLDVRAERTFVFDRFVLKAYLSVENATNHKNVEGHYYSWDYLRQYYITGLPIVPIFGVRGSF